jgi:hypothetical protein
MATTGIADTSSSEQRTGSQVSGIGQTLRDATYQKLTDQKTRASDTLGSVAGAIRGMTEPLREDGQSSVADYVDKAAEGIDRWADQLRQRDINDTVRAVHDFARREPALFLGLSFGAGALLARFLKSSTADNHRSYAAGSRGLAGGPASVRRDPTVGGTSRGGASQSTTAAVSAATVGTDQTSRTSHESPLVSSEMPSGREVL